MKSRNAHLIVGSLIVAAATLVAGCQPTYDGPGRYHVSGNVTYQGKPIDDGSIVFFPLELGQGPQIGLKIVNGSFSGDVTAGLKKVSIEGHRPGKTIIDEEGHSHETLDYYVPGKYGEGSKLTYTILPERNEGLAFDLQ